MGVGVFQPQPVGEAAPLGALVFHLLDDVANPQSLPGQIRSTAPTNPQCICPDGRRRTRDRAFLLAALADTPVVVVNGARQVGKTTLGDRDRRPGRFLLIGSARLLSAPDMADALVGRVEIIEIWPFSQGERAGFADGFVDMLFTAPRELTHGSDLRRTDLVDRITTGGFPDIVARPPARRRPWFDNYLTTATQSVIRELSAIERLAEIPRLLRLCAERTGTELNVTALANELSIPARTTDGYLALPETAFLIHRVPAWSTNLSRKVIRRPKLVVSDMVWRVIYSASRPRRWIVPVARSVHC